MAVFYNPHNKNPKDLPTIFGYADFVFGDESVVGYLLAEDGESLGPHLSSDKCFLFL